MRPRSVVLPVLLLAVLALLAGACGSDDGVDAGDTGDDATPTAEDETDTEEDNPEDETDTEGDDTEGVGVGDGDDAAGSGGDDPAAGEGTLVIALEEVEGVFIEGFEVGLRIEQPDGIVVSSWRWNDVVDQFGDGTVRAFYEAVLEEPVPAGTLVVLATVNVGIGPPPEVPDLDGEMDCRIKVEVPAGGRAEVEVNFSGTPDCLRQLA